MTALYNFPTQRKYNYYMSLYEINDKVVLYDTINMYYPYQEDDEKILCCMKCNQDVVATSPCVCVLVCVHGGHF